MSSRLSYLEESTVEKHHFEQTESKVIFSPGFHSVCRVSTLSALH